MHWSRQIRRPLLLVLLMSMAAHERAQDAFPAPLARQGWLMSDANRPPDTNDVLLMKQQKQGAYNFEAVNASRRKQIDEDSVKLVILANDLKKRVDALGDGPIPPQLLREAAVIELLARNVQLRMKLTVGAG